jgi:protease IV
MLLGFIILGSLFLFFWGGITLFITLASNGNQAEIFGNNKNGIGVIHIIGPIVSSDETIEQLRDFRRSDSIKAVIIRLDSPGGAVGASQEIFEEIKKTNYVKPVIASIGSIAASGAYYAAIGAEKIMVNPGSLTGSIGVIIKFANLQELFSKIGYQSEVIKSGKWKDIGSPNRQITSEERELLQEIIGNIHSQFTKAVAENRNLPIEKVKELASGRIFSGEQALEEGLVDLTGNFSDAIELAANLGGLNTKYPHLIYPKKDKPLLELLTGKAAINILGQMENYSPLYYQWSLTSQ